MFPFSVFFKHCLEDDMTCQASVMKLHDLDALSVGFPEFGVAALHGIYVSQSAGVREAQGASE